MAVKSYESGVTTKSVAVDAKFVARAKREEIQRQCALRRLKQVWRSMPKRERDTYIGARRDAKYKLAQEQSGVGLAALCVGSGLAAGAAVGYATGSHLRRESGRLPML